MVGANAQQRPAPILETNRHIGGTQIQFWPNVESLKGPYRTPEQACRAEIYFPSYPDNNYAGLTAITGSYDFSCHCASNPPPAACGAARYICPAGWGASCHTHPDAPWAPGPVCEANPDETCTRAPATVDPLRNNGQCDSGATGCIVAGNPIHVRTGNKFQLETDIDVAKGGIAYRRFYNSVITEARAGSHGLHWRSEYDRRLVLYAGFIVAEREDGKGLYFRAAPNGAWLGDSDANGRLHQLNDQNGSISGWKLVLNGRNEFYSSAGVLQRIESPDEAVDLLYDGELLSRVTDRNGRSLSFHYDNQKRVDQVIWGGLVISYHYDQKAMMDVVTYSRDGWSSSRSYVYDPQRADLLTGIVDENGMRFATWAYDSSHRATVSFHGAAGAEADRVDITYDAGGVSHVLRNGNSTTTLATAVSNGLVKLTESQTTCAGCATDSLAYTYDTNGRVDTVTDSNGTTTDYDYDLGGRLVLKIEVANEVPGGAP